MFQRKNKAHNVICPKCASSNSIFLVETIARLGQFPFVCESCSHSWLIVRDYKPHDPFVREEADFRCPCGGFHDLVSDEDEGSYYCQKCHSYIV